MIHNSHSSNMYINRELSWIDFNERVLAHALDQRTKLLDQAKFSSIFSNNLDEFFMVRVASLKSQVEAGITKKSNDDQTPIEQLFNIRSKLLPILIKQENHYIHSLKTQLENEKIFILDYIQLNARQRSWVNSYFQHFVFPILTPLGVDPTHPFPFVSNLSLNIAALIYDPQSKQQQFARVKVPQKTIDRFIKIPTELHDSEIQPIFTMIPIEEIVAYNLKMLFPGMEIQEHSFFRVTRDADLELRELEADDLMIALEEGLRKRRLGGEVVRLEVSKNMPQTLLSLLMDGMAVKEEDLYIRNCLLALDELIKLSNLDLPHLKSVHASGQTHKSLKSSQSAMLEDGSIKKEEFESIFSIIRKKDILLHHPYDLFTSSVEEFINQSADDPLVMGIKMTLYRVSKDSQIIQALIRAAEKGKQVMALVELKARFDEDNNIQWAKQLEKSGVHVVYGLIGLKTHTKIALVIRKENNYLRSYFHIGTGNYNSKTAKLYTDIGLLSIDKEIGKDLVELFNYLSGFSKQQNFRKLLIAPINLREGFEKLIQREIHNAKQGKVGKIRAKMNSLVDPKIIQSLYKASNAGVKIELLIRGMCCLYPGKQNLSENIKVISIIGHYLEHSRIFWFFNNNNPEVYIGSADWMRRNLDRRVEALTPINDSDLKAKLEHLFDLYLNDNYNAWEMNANGEFIQRHPNNNPPNCSQIQLHSKEANQKVSQS